MAPARNKNYYSVAKGRQTGIYTDWSSCENSVCKFHNAAFKGFKTIDEAIVFLIAGNVYLNCEDIPVYDSDHINRVNSYGHSCRGVCNAPRVNDSDTDMSDEEDDQEVLLNIDTHDEVPAHNDEITEVKQVVQTEHKCSFCSNKCPDNSKVLQCSVCKALCHWACTKLPLYQLYMYELSSRKYSCESCVEIPESVRLEYASISDSKEENSKKKAPVLNKGIQTHSPVIPGVEEGTNTEFVKTFDRGTEMDKTLLASGEEESNVDTNQRFDKLESEFVKIVDRLSSRTENSSADIKNNSSDKISAGHRKVEESSQVAYKETKAKLEVAEKKCKDMTGELEKAEKRNKELQAKVNNMFVKNEILKTQLEGDIQVLKAKVKTEQLIAATVQSDLNNLEQRYSNRNELILDYDKKVTAQIAEINKLQDEILSLKLHSCRANDDLLRQPYEELNSSSIIEITPSKPRSPLRKPATDTLSSHSTPKPKDKSEQSNRDIEEHVDELERKSGNQDHAQRKRKQVLLVGTSNTRYLSARYIAGKQAFVRKITQYTVEDAIKFMDTYNLDMSPELIIFQLGCNEGSDDNVELVTKMEQLVTLTKSKFPGASISVSLGLPRREREENAYVISQSIKLRRTFEKDPCVQLCDNSNLFFRGRPSRGILNDNKHLTKKGTQILGQNLKRAVDRFVERKSQ